MKKIKTVKEFIKRLENKESVSRFKFELEFEWTTKTSADLNSADLSGANLSGANLRGAEGTFFFSYGVKLKVMKE